MKVVVFAKEDQKNIILELVDFVCNKKYDIVYFEKLSNFAQFIYDCTSKNLNENLKNSLDEIFLIFADYSLFPMDCVNPYLSLIRQEVAFPLCLYNDPYPSPEQRAAYWISKNHFYYENFISKKRFSEIAEVFTKLQYFLLLPNISKKISVICDSYKSENNDESKIENQNQLESNSLKIIKSESEKTLPLSRYKLLKYFLSHLNQEIELKTLSNFMWGNSTQDKSKSLYAYINDLRRMLENIPNCEFELLRTKKGFYKMQYNKIITEDLPL